MISLSRPCPQQIDAYLARLDGQPFSYAALGATRDDTPPAGYTVDHRRVCLGRGAAAFRAACECLRRWEMFQLGWVTPCWPHIAPEPGAVVATLARLAGVWFLNPCRVVYVEGPDDDARRFRFAYGTLAGHVEEGEERFTVERLADDTVWYDLYAFSRPGHWLVRLGYPAARWVQKRAGAGSVRAVARAVRRRLAGQGARRLT